MSNSKWSVNRFRRILLVNKLNSIANKPLSVDDLYRTVLIDLLIKKDLKDTSRSKLIHDDYQNIQMACDKAGKSWVEELSKFIEHGLYNSTNDLPKEFKPYHRLLVEYYERLVYFSQVYILNESELELFASHLNPTILAKSKRASKIYVLNSLYYNRNDCILSLGSV